MATITAYHVVTDRPMTVGQHIVFDENHHSGVYSRVKALADVAAEALAHPDKYPLPLEHHLSVALRELAMEEVRQARYAQYPSRMACLYVSSTLEEARRWGQFFSRIGRPTYAIVEVRSAGRLFVGDACNCFDGTPDKSANLAKADHYWQNLPNDEGEPVQEMLVDGEIEVVRIVEEINANLSV